MKTKLILISLSVLVTAAACGGRSGVEVFNFDILNDSGADVMEDGRAGTSGAAGSDSGKTDAHATGGQAGGSDAQAGGQGGSDAGDLDASIDGMDVDGSSDAIADARTDTPTDAPIDSKKDSPEKDVVVKDGSNDAPHDAILDTTSDTSFPIGCIVCVPEKCGNEISGCFGNSACMKGIQCSMTKCISAGSPDITCLLECFDGDSAAMLTALSILTCVSKNCGEECMSMLYGS